MLILSSLFRDFVVRITVAAKEVTRTVPPRVFVHAKDAFQLGRE